MICARRWPASAALALALAMPAQGQSIYAYTDINVGVSDTACRGSESCTSARSIERLVFPGYSGVYDNTSERSSTLNGQQEYWTLTPGASAYSSLSRSSSFGSARAYVDLRSGKMGVLANGSADGYAAAGAFFQDALTFNVAGAGAETITRINATARLHATSVQNAAIYFALCPLSSGCEFYASAGFGGQFASALAPGGLTNYYSNRSFAASLSGDILTIDWSFDVLGPTSTLKLSAGLSGYGGYGQNGGTDMINTASFAFVLPENVSFASASNQFLRGPAVPEPASWAMMIVGFALVGAAMRRRQTAAPSNGLMAQ